MGGVIDYATTKKGREISALLRSRAPRLISHQFGAVLDFLHFRAMRSPRRVVASPCHSVVAAVLFE